MCEFRAQLSPHRAVLITFLLQQEQLKTGCAGQMPHWRLPDDVMGSHRITFPFLCVLTRTVFLSVSVLAEGEKDGGRPYKLSECDGIWGRMLGGL